MGIGRLLAGALVAGTLAFGTAQAQEKTLRIGVVTFLSGAAAGPFGVPARNAAELFAETVNAGKLPAPYSTKGFGGQNIELVIIDESGPATKVVTDYRNLVQRQNVDLIIGYVSSGNCLAVAPVAEELKKLTVFFDCGTPRIFEDASYKHVFRTQATATMDSVGAALYVLEQKKNVKRIAGINQNYAWGQDSWGDFEAAMKKMEPSVTVATSQMPKLFAGQFGAEISALLSANADVIHSSFWNGDLEAFIVQAGPRGLFKKSMVVLTTGETAFYKMAKQIQDGTVIGARGRHSIFAEKSALNDWFQSAYRDRFGAPPNYASYHMLQAFLGTKAAWDKAMIANSNSAPNQDQVIAAFENIEFDAPAGRIKMSLGKGHQATQSTAYGTFKLVKGEPTITNVKVYPAERVNPPEGVKSGDWIKNQLQR
jgi:branched-chain amino acid transport system substrate-binding protein